MNDRGYLNKQAALSNILLKKEILQRWSVSQIPTSKTGELEYFPTTIRQFNAWDLSRNGDELKVLLPKISKNANDTLNNYLATRAEVQTIISALILRSTITKVPGVRLSKVKKDCASLRLYITSLEFELIELRLERLDWNNKMIMQESRYKSFLQEVDILKANYAAAIRDLSAENNDLVKMLSKIKGIRAV